MAQQRHKLRSRVSRLPRAVNISASALPQTPSLPTATQIDIGGRRLLRQGNRLARRDARLASVTSPNAAVDMAFSPGMTDGSQFFAPNLPTMPGITKAAIRRERNNVRKMDKAINKINKLNELRDKQGASLALGLNQPVDYSQVQTQGQFDPFAPAQTGEPAYDPATGQYLDPSGYPAPQYPQPGYYPAPPGYPAGYGPTEPLFYPGAQPVMFDYPQSGGSGPIFASQISQEQSYGPIEVGWQDTVPFDVPMTDTGDLLFMQPNDDILGEPTMNENFAAYIGGRPRFDLRWDDMNDSLDSFAAFSAEPNLTPSSAPFTGLTNLLTGGAKAFTDARNANVVAKTNAQQALLARQEAKRNAGKVSPVMLGVGLLAVGALIYLGTRGKK